MASRRGVREIPNCRPSTVGSSQAFPKCPMCCSEKLNISSFLKRHMGHLGTTWELPTVLGRQLGIPPTPCPLDFSPCRGPAQRRERALPHRRACSVCSAQALPAVCVLGVRRVSCTNGLRLAHSDQNMLLLGYPVKIWYNFFAGLLKYNVLPRDGKRTVHMNGERFVHLVRSKFAK